MLNKFGNKDTAYQILDGVIDKQLFFILVEFEGQRIAQIQLNNKEYTNLDTINRKGGNIVSIDMVYDLAYQQYQVIAVQQSAETGELAIVTQLIKFEEGILKLDNQILNQDALSSYPSNCANKIRAT